MHKQAALRQAWAMAPKFVPIKHTSSCVYVVLASPQIDPTALFIFLAFASTPVVDQGTTEHC